MLRNEDTFRVLCVNNISEDMIVSLMNLYQPLVGSEGVLLYMTLRAEGNKQQIPASHKHLTRVMNTMSLDVLERARFRLEEYNLLRSYCKDAGNHKNWIYSLNTPLTSKDFLSNGIYVARLRDAIGYEECESIASRLVDYTEVKGYEDVTKPFKASHQEVQMTEIKTDWSKIKPKLSFDVHDSDITFDYDHFLATTTNTVFPVSLRTKENMALIGRLGTVFAIDADRMRVLVKRCSNFEPPVFNADKLRYLCENEKPQEVSVKDPYQLSPVSYLQSKNKGKEVVLTEKKILEKLAVDFKFSNEVINTLLDYVLSTSNNSLIEKYVMGIASQWTRSGVETREDALAFIKKNPTRFYNQPRQVVPLPAHMLETTEEKPASKEELEKALKYRRQMKESRK